MLSLNETSGADVTAEVREVLRKVGVFRDYGEPKSIVWHALVNGVLASHAVPQRLRTVALMALGLKIDHRALVRGGVFIRTPAVDVGRGSTLNVGCVVDNRAPVTIGQYVGIGIGVKLITSDHEVTDPWRRAGAETLQPIVIGDGCYIGSSVTVLSGVTIGPGTVIAAGSVVNRDCLPDSLYGGVPARLIRSLNARGES